MYGALEYWELQTTCYSQCVQNWHEKIQVGDCVLLELCIIYSKIHQHEELNIEYTKSNIFPKKICAIRWIENVAVKRAIEIVLHLMMYVIKSKKEKTAPNSQNFKIVFDALNLSIRSLLFSAQQHILSSLFEPFLRDFKQIYLWHL